MDKIDLTIHSWALGQGLSLSLTQMGLIHTYLRELLLWNQRMNLTGLTGLDRIVSDLLLDSLVPAPFLPTQGCVLDAGSGAGFPAIPLKICRPDLLFHLMEINSRKVSFLRQVIRLLNLNGIKAFRGRVEEDQVLLEAEGYPVVTTRAMAPLPEALQTCGPRVKPGGILFAFQGSEIRGLLDKSSEVLKRQGLSLERSLAYTLPGKGHPRHLLLFRKGNVPHG